MMKLATSAFALATVLTTATSAFADKTDDTFRIALAEEILSLDYLYTTKREYIILAQMTDATLFELNPETAEYMPSVASGHEWIDDTTLDIRLREDVKFHDGTMLSADDVVYTYNWIVSANSDSKAKGAINRWLGSAEKTGPHTVRFNLKTVYPLVLRDMAQRVVLRKNGAYEVDGVINQDSMASDFIGAGPYMVDRFEPGQELVLKRFDGYFDEAPAIENVVVRNLPDIGTQQAELMSGGIDWMFKVPMDLAQSLGATPLADHLSGNDMRVGFLVLDAAGYTDPEGPLTHAKVRQAVNHALNTAEMSKFLIGGSSEPIHTPCHPVQFGCTTDIARYAYDPAKARALLAEAGYPDGFPLELWAYRDKAVSEAIAADLTAVGIEVDLRYVKLASLNQARANRDIPAYFGTWGSGGTADTAAIARVHFSDTSDRNLSGDSVLTAEVLAAESTNDRAARAGHYKTALNMIADQAYWAPLFTYSANYLVSPDLDFPLSPDGLPRLDQASWK